MIEMTTNSSTSVNAVRPHLLTTGNLTSAKPFPIPGQIVLSLSKRSSASVNSLGHSFPILPHGQPIIELL